MTQYFAVIDEADRRGPFDSVDEPVTLLKSTSRSRGHTDAEAHHFFLYESAVEQVVTIDGKVECIVLGWLAREKAGIDAL
jgi:hypothetical protein